MCDICDTCGLLMHRYFLSSRFLENNSKLYKKRIALKFTTSFHYTYSHRYSAFDKIWITSSRSLNTLKFLGSRICWTVLHMRADCENRILAKHNVKKRRRHAFAATKKATLLYSRQHVSNCNESDNNCENIPIHGD